MPARCRGRLELADKRGRLRAHDREQRFDRLEHAGDTSEGERGRAEADDFAIVRRRVAPDDVDRIGGRVDVIEGSIEIFEPRTEHRGPADPRTREPENPYFGNGLSPGVFPGGSGVRPTLSTIEIIE